MVGQKKRIVLFFQQNCICIAAFLTVALLYSKVAPVLNREPYFSLIPPQQVRALDCQVISNPVKTGSGKLYRCSVRLQQVQGSIAGNNATTGSGSQLALAQASGRATVYLPAAFVEAFYPGKLYSALSSKTATTDAVGLVEQGVYLHLGLQENFSSKKATASPSITSSESSTINNSSLVGGEPVFYASTCSVLGYGDSWWGRIQEFRGLCRLQFKRLMYGWGDAGGLLVALLCGSGEYTDKEVGDAFRSAGLAHVLALSGMHLSFFAGLAATVFRGGGRKFSLVLSLGAVLLFVWFAGLTPSLLRATICSLLGMATGIWGIKSPMIRILSLCFFIHLVLAPQDLFQLSFQLSYLALAGILLLGPCFELVTHKFLPASVATSVSASVGAQIFSTPVTLLSLGTMMPGGIIASVVVSPLVSLFMTVGVGAIILSLLWAPLGEPLGHLVNLLYTCLIIPVKLFARIPALELP